MESGVKKGDTSIGLLYRQEYRTEFTKDTADYYYDSQQHQLEPNRKYQLNLETHSFNAKGMRLQQKFTPVENLEINLGGSVLQSYALQDGKLIGNSTANANGKDQNYTGNIEYYYDQDRLFDRPDVNAPRGKGYSVDANVNWEISDHWEADVIIRDLLGELYWDKAPYTNAKIDSDVKVVGADGYTKVKSKLAGKEGYKNDFRQKLQPKVDAVLKYNSNNSATFLAIKHIPEKTLWGIGKELPMMKGTVTASFWPEDKLLKVGYARKHLNLFVGSDNINPVKANTVWAGFELN